MKIYQVQGCPFAYRARIALEEKKLKYEIEYFTPRDRPAELTAIGPDARSPTIFDDEGTTTVWNSLVVIEYLEERYPELPLMPREASRRALVRLLIREVEERLMAAGAFIAEEFVHKPPAERDDAKVQEGIRRLHDALVAWNARLEGKAFLLGDQFTLGDIALFTPAIYSMVKLLGERGDIPASLPNLRAWRDRVAARPSAVY